MLFDQPPSQLLAQLSIDPVFGWMALVPLAIVLLASLWLTLTCGGVSRRGRLLLAALRLSAMLVLLVGWMRPAMLTNREIESAGAIAILMDRSQSMTLPSDSSQQTRWEVQQEIWKSLQSSTGLSIGQTKLIPYFYDRDLTPAPGDDLPELTEAFSTQPTGRLTDLGAAISKINRLQLDPPLRGVILMGDATQTLLPPEVDASVAARQMAQLDQPIILVGIGPRGEQSQLKDIALEGLPEHMTAFVKKDLRVPLVVHAQGMQSMPVNITLHLAASGKPSQKVGERKIIASNANEKMALEFTIVVPDEGEYLLTAEATVDGREISQANNKAISFVTVREGGVKILYLEGQPRSEQLFLKRSLDASLDFSVQYYWFKERDRRQWPLEANVDLQQFDALIIGDLDESALSDSLKRSILNRVRRGAGILLLGGYHSFDAGGYGRSPLAEIFPVELGVQSQAWDAPINTAFHWLDDIPLKPTRPHPITTLAPEPDNSRLWNQLPPMQGMNRLGKIRAAAGVQVLLEGPERQPALVTGEFGTGRVLAFAGDSSWRWWLAGHPKIHQQFWRQAMLWLIQRDTLSEGFKLDLARRRLTVDATPELSIEWFAGSDNKPLPSPIKIELSRDGRWLRNLEITQLTSNTLRSTIVGLDAPGLYRAALSATGSDGQAYTTDVAFIVADDSRELVHPGADWQMMDSIAAANAPAGGQVVFPEEIGQAIQWLRERQQATQVTTIEKRRLGDAAWDAWLYLVIFCALMSLEWGLRKSWQLP